MKNQGGFTLLEVLVVMLILGVLASTISLALPDGRRQAQVDSVHAWQRQAALAARLAQGGGATLGWRVGESHAQLLQAKDGLWQPLERSGTASLAEGVSLQNVEVEGLRQPLGSLIVFPAGEPPLFTLHLAAVGQHWRLEGLPNGTVRLVSAQDFDRAGL